MSDKGKKTPKIEADQPKETVCNSENSEKSDQEYQEKITKLEGLLEKQSHKLSVLQYMTEIFTSAPKPKKIVRILADLFSSELGARVSAVWIKEPFSTTFQPNISCDVKKELLEGWRLPIPNPFPNIPMLLSQPQWLESSILPDLQQVLGIKDNIEPYYIPFEFKTELVGFSIVGIDSEYQIENDKDALSALGHIVAASLFNTNLLTELREKLDEINQKTDELEKTNAALIDANRFKNEFFTMTSHELRTPLTGILGFTKLIIDGLYEDEDEMRQMLEDNYSSGKSLLRLVNNILDMSKIESGSFHISLEPVSLQDCFSEISHVINNLPKEHGVVINMPDGLESMPKVIADMGSLCQVLINLISNAIKFTHAGSVTVMVERGIGVINISVIDTGIGVSPESQTRLFQNFVQADEGYSRKYGGTGLGLAICKHLLGMMNSTISLHSKGVGYGTTISFAIPIA
ncbi:MAG: HAMP domain-containing histidine kinase [Holophagaceae bacterium]|nr:HAMP domain-containing histidine kinase [Holophagaceae bacterium]